MIELHNISKSFGGLLAVHNLNLTIPPGEFFAFIGPNGAGKTTTIKMITGLLRPTQGRIILCGDDVQDDYIAAKKRLSYVPDQPYLYDKLTGREFLQFVARMYELDPQQTERRISELSETFGMAHFLDELGETYSHGMKQRVVISAAMLHDPEVLVVDEPLVGLDPQGANTLKRVMTRAADNGTSIFMSTHTLSLAEEVADRVGVLDEGEIIALGDLSEIREKAQTKGHLEEAFLRLTRETTSTAPQVTNDSN